MEDLLLEDPALIKKEIDYCRQAGTVFAKAMRDAGAHVTSIGDAYAGPSLISPGMFREFALQPEAEMIREVQEYGISFSIHICGDTTGILPNMATTNARILEIDWQVDMAWAREIVPDDIILMGNINPSDPLAFGTSSQVDEVARKVIENTGGRSLYLSSGCAMGRNTPPDNLRAMVHAAKKYGNHDRLIEMRKK